jgi:hypothetical protein
VEHKYALWGFDDRNRPVTREDLRIGQVNRPRKEMRLRTYHIKPMQGDPPPKPPANRSFVRREDNYERISLGQWMRETYHFSDIDTRPQEE